MEREVAWSDRAQPEPAAVQALVERAKADPTAFGELYDLYVDGVYAYARRRLGSPVDAEDVTAETFTRALQQLHRFRWRGGGFGAWLLRIAANLCADTLAARGRLTVGLADGRESAEQRGADEANGGARPFGSDPEDAAIARDEWARLRSLVAKLPEPQHHVVLLKYAAGLTNPEIAAVTGRSTTAVSSLLHRAISRLRKGWMPGHDD